MKAFARLMAWLWLPGAPRKGSDGSAPAPGVLRARIAEWARRYLPLEILATFTALVGGLTVATFTDSPVATAFAGTWGENVGYYGLAFARELKALSQDGASPPALSLPERVSLATRRLLWEFGFAELIDSLVARPFCMFTAGVVVGSPELGIVVGKIVADILFYAIAIVFYEIGKRAR